MIPKKLYFTYKSHELPDRYKKNLNIWNFFCHDWEFYLYSNKQVISFFKTYFPHYLSDIKKIKQGVVLADVFRYAVIFQFGGMYSDVDTFPLKPIPDSWLSKECVIGYEYQPSKFKGTKPKSFTKDTLCQWTFLAKPNHPLFKEALDTCINKLREKNFYLNSIQDVLETTGPISFTEVAQKYLKSPKIHVLDVDVVAPIRTESRDYSKCVVVHQFHGGKDWKSEIKLPHIKWLEN